MEINPLFQKIISYFTKALIICKNLLILIKTLFMRFLFFFVLLINFTAQSQVSGFILDDLTNEPIIGAKIYCSDGNRSISGFDGDFKLKSNTSRARLASLRSAIGMIRLT